MSPFRCSAPCSLLLPPASSTVCMEERYTYRVYRICTGGHRGQKMSFTLYKRCTCELFVLKTWQSSVHLRLFHLCRISFADNVFRLPCPQSAREWKIEVVSVDWLWACEKANRLVGATAYRLKPFTGLTICCTGFDQGMCSDAI